MLEVLPQERVQRRTLEQIVDPVPVAPLLHVFVREQLVDILARLDIHVAEQVNDVPKIRVSTPRCSHSPPCAADGRTVGGSADDYLLFFPVAADSGAER